MQASIMTAWFWIERIRRFPGIAFAALFAWEAEVRAETGAEMAAQAQEIWLAVTLNNQPLPGAALLLRRADGTLLARGQDWHTWRLSHPDVVPHWHHGEAYYPLDGLPGLAYRVDESTQTVAIEAAPELFPPTHLRPGTPYFAPPTPSGPGGFLNYDFLAERATGDTRLNGLFELGAFNGAGVGTASALGRTHDGETRWLRLETTWTRDRPEALASLRLGDAITRAGAWGRPVRFGGVQWATDFSVQPGFVAFPLPSVAGEAALPATVDLYVNDVLRAREAVPPGPFRIDDLPVVTGEGELRVVVRDLLGREQVLSERYYASSRLLRPGVRDFSYEAGFVRENFALASNDYGRFFAATTWREGLDERLTGELRAELLRTQQTVGASGTFLWTPVGMFTASAAASRSEDAGARNGWLGALGFEGGGPRFNLGLRTRMASPGFVQLGLPQGERAPARLSEARLGFSSPGIGTLGLAWVDQDNRDRDDIRIASLSHQSNISRGSLILSLSRITTLDRARRTDHVVAATLVLPLGTRTSASISAARQGGDSRGTFLLQSNLPAGEGLGYRVQASMDGNTTIEAGVSAQGPVGTYTAAAARADGDTAWRLGAAGGLAVLDGEPFFARRLTDSFALVRAGDYPDVAVYADNQPVARTDAEGRALIPRLRAYQPNVLRMGPADLPLDAEVESYERTVVPYRRSGLLVSFAAHPAHGALLRLVLDDGAPLPAGAQVYVEDRDRAFPVAFDGEVYVTGLDAASRLSARWNGQDCTAGVPSPPPGDPLPDLGTFVCTRGAP